MSLKNDLHMFNPVAEHSIEFATEFFSFQKNRNETFIENVFFPVFQSYSQKMDGGRIFDINIFKQRLIPEQLDFCRRILGHAKILRLGTDKISANHIFNYVKQFGDAEELTISIIDDDEFEFPEELFSFSKLSINCSEQNLYAGGVEK